VARSIELVAVLGSVTPPGRLQGAVEGALERLERAGAATTQLVNLADRRIALADGRPAADLGDDTEAVIAAINSADAVLFATPVYRGSLTGALKNLFDQLPVSSLQWKATAILAMGARPEHFLGVERHVRDVLAFFGAVVAPVAGYLTSDDFVNGALQSDAEAQLDQLLSGLLALATALTGADAALGPVPLAAVRRRPARSG
jgi:FMN reductase